LEASYVPHRLAHEIVDVERIADVHHVCVLDWLGRMLNVDPDDVMMFGKKSQ
jgi:hypothetical protein